MPNYDDILNKIDESNQRKFDNWSQDRTPHSGHEKPSFDNYVTNKVVAKYTYDKATIDQKTAGGGGGGTVVSSITIPTSNDASPAKPGKFGVNLFDYRWLANNWNNPLLFVDGKTFKNKGKYANESNSKHWVGGSIGIPGVKEGRTLKIDSVWKTSETAGTFKIQYNNTKDSASDNSTITAGATGSTTHKSNFYGSYSLTLGADDNQSPKHYEASIQPYYGEIQPKGLSRKFVFETFNGYTLKSNYDSVNDNSGAWRLRDEYIPGKIYDEVVYKLGHVRLKDCNLYRPAEEHTQADKELFLCVEMPADASIGQLGHSHTDDQTIGAQALTNNLPETSNVMDEQILAGKDVMPHFLKDIVKIPVFEKQKDGSVKTVTKNCWIIIASPACAYRYQDLLAKTEIIYPLASEKRVKVPNSGFIVTLADGSYVESWKYTQITDNGDGTYKFGASTLGYPTIKIQKSQIVSVTPTT